MKTDQLNERVAALLQERRTALSPAEIAEALDLRGAGKKKLQASLHALITSGLIVRIRDQRYALGETADLVTGRLTVLRSGHGIVAGPDRQVFIPQAALGTALPGDRVIARIDADGRTDRPGMTNGQVIRIEERGRHEVVGTLRSDGRFFFVVPMQASYSRSLYVPDMGPARLDDRVVCRFVQWTDPQVNPEGVIVETLGPADDPSTDTLAVIKQFGLPEAFPEEVVKEAENAAVLVDRPGARLDCRALVTFTIDPARARDFDDALSLEPGPEGTQELGVHIADVAHFVRPDSALDREAMRRGNSVYLPDSVLPMLPEALSNGVCSLRPDEDRLAFSVFMTVNARGEVTASRFAKTRIRSAARLTYEQAMAVIDGDTTLPLAPPVRERLPALHRLAQQLRQNRFGRFALDLDMPECEIVMGEGGRIRDIRVVRNDASHQLVEECMVAANEAVARELSHRGLALISRLHEPPKPEKIEELSVQLMEMGYAPGDLNQPRHLSKFLKSVQDDPLVMHVRMAVLRSLNRALYSAEKGGHYGLAKEYYAHFTSPIRRYADLTVHRQLQALLEGGRRAGGRAALTRAALAPVAENCSMTELVADEAERTLDEIKKYRYLEQQLAEGQPRAWPAVVVAVMNFGAFVELVDLQIQGLVHVSALSKEFVVFDRGAHVLRAGRTEYRVGTRLSVRPANVNFEKRKIDFVPEGHPPAEARGGGRSMWDEGGPQTRPARRGGGGGRTGGGPRRGDAKGTERSGGSGGGGARRSGGRGGSAKGGGQAPAGTGGRASPGGRPGGGGQASKPPKRGGGRRKRR